eukprot:gene10788-12570_t
MKEIDKEYNKKVKEMHPTLSEFYNDGDHAQKKEAEARTLEKDKDDFSQIDRRTFIKESYTIMPKKSDRADSEYVEAQLKSNKFDDDLDEESGWREWDYKKEGIKKYDNSMAEKQELAKKGLTRNKNDGLLYCANFAIPDKFESLFTDPEGPRSRSEKKYFERLDEMIAARNEGKTGRRRKQRKTIVDENMDEHTIVQKRMSDRILEVLNESVLFDGGETDTLQTSQMGDQNNLSEYGFFRDHREDDLDETEEIRDPVLARANLVLSKATMSSDLRWVKVYWTREDPESEIDNHITQEMGRLEYVMEDEQYDEELEEDQEDMEDDEDMEEEEEEEEDMKLPDILSNLQTSGAKRFMYKIHKRGGIEGERKVDVRSESSSHNKANTVTTEIIKQEPVQIDSGFSFGSSASVASFDKIQLNVTIPTLEQSLLEPTKVVDDGVGDGEDQGEETGMDAERKKRLKKYEAVSDEQVTKRLIALTPRLRLYLAKRIKQRYVPNIYFVKDKQQKKMDVAIDLFDTLVIPELVSAARQKRDLESTRSKQLKNRFMGVFKTDSGDSTMAAGMTTDIQEKDYMDQEFADEILREEKEPQALSELQDTQQPDKEVEMEQENADHHKDEIEAELHFQN